MSKPWMNSTDLVSAIKRKISFPTSQATFSDDEVLNFVNEELAINALPALLQAHEEYLVYKVRVPLVPFQHIYPIPNRAVGMRLRALYWEDNEHNLFEMARVMADDQAYYQKNNGPDMSIQKYFIQGNDVHLIPYVQASAYGYLSFSFFLRPNQLVTVDRAATAINFVQTLTINDSLIVAGDSITINANTYIAGTDFAIGSGSVSTAINLSTLINNSSITNGVTSILNGTPSTNVMTLRYGVLNNVFTTTNVTGFAFLTGVQQIEFDNVPANITSRSLVDFLQTLPGHRIYTFDIQVPYNGISGNIITFLQNDVPSTFVLGDYVCSQNECIIPQLPPELHTGLAERASARILAAIGDTAGLQVQNQKVSEIQQKEMSLIDNRVEGSPQKITARHSILRFTKMGPTRTM